MEYYCTYLSLRKLFTRPTAKFKLVDESICSTRYHKTNDFMKRKLAKIESEMSLSIFKEWLVANLVHNNKFNITFYPDEYTKKNMYEYRAYMSNYKYWLEKDIQYLLLNKPQGIENDEHIINILSSNQIFESLEDNRISFYSYFFLYHTYLCPSIKKNKHIRYEKSLKALKAYLNLSFKNKKPIIDIVDRTI